MKITKETDSTKLFQLAADKLNELLESNSENAILLMLSGGSALKLLEKINSDFLAPEITITVLDERYSEDTSINNFAQITQTSFYATAVEKGCHFIGTTVKEGQTLEECAADFEAGLRTWKEENPEGKVIITQGMGPDGHTSGIMPFPEDHEDFDKFFQGERWVVGYDAGNKNPYSERFSTTITFLKDIVDYSVLYITGKEKQEILTKALSEKGNIYKTPIEVIKEMKGEVYLFTDL